jgi:hypothetical protein
MAVGASPMATLTRTCTLTAPAWQRKDCICIIAEDHRHENPALVACAGVAVVSLEPVSSRFSSLARNTTCTLSTR